MNITTSVSPLHSLVQTRYEEPDGNSTALSDNLSGLMMRGAKIVTIKSNNSDKPTHQKNTPNLNGTALNSGAVQSSGSSVKP